MSRLKPWVSEVTYMHIHIPTCRYTHRDICRERCVCVRTHTHTHTYHPSIYKTQFGIVVPPAIPTLRRGKEDLKFKAILDFTTSWRLAWAT